MYSGEEKQRGADQKRTVVFLVINTGPIQAGGPELERGGSGKVLFIRSHAW